MTTSITALEKAAQALARRLSAAGFVDLRVDAYRSGRGGDPTVSRASHVDVSATLPPRDAESDSTYVDFSLTTGVSAYHDQIDDRYGGVGAMVAEAVRRIERETGVRIPARLGGAKTPRCAACEHEWRTGEAAPNANLHDCEGAPR